MKQSKNMDTFETYQLTWERDYYLCGRIFFSGSYIWFLYFGMLSICMFWLLTISFYVDSSMIPVSLWYVMTVDKSQGLCFMTVSLAFKEFRFFFVQMFFISISLNSNFSSSRWLVQLACFRKFTTEKRTRMVVSWFHTCGTFPGVQMKALLSILTWLY